MARSTSTRSISQQTVRHIAGLARLKLSDEAVKLASSQLSVILGHMADLEQVDTTGVEPIGQIADLSNVFQPDEPGSCLSQEQVLAQVKSKQAGRLKVRSVL